MLVLEFPIAPVPKPRQTRADKWKQRECVMRYRAFADECRLRGVTVQDGDHITFVLPMPTSWPKHRRLSSDGLLHRQRPDLDNLCKAIFDAVHKDDSGIADLGGLRKVWGQKGMIVIRREIAA